MGTGHGDSECAALLGVTQPDSHLLITHEQ